MLPPDYFTNKEDRILQLYRELEDFILKDITRRLLSAGEMTATADRMIWKLKQMGESQVSIERKLRKMTGLAKKELRVLLQDAVIASWKDDSTVLRTLLGYLPRNPLKNSNVIRIMDAEYKKSLGELENLTRTTMKQSQIDLINMLDEADLRVAAGVQSYSAAVCDILDRYAGRGIYVDYPTGARRTLEAAVRCCVVTSMNQTAAQVTNQYIVEAGSEYVLVSRHTGARHSKYGGYIAQHDLWQGKIYKIRGEDKDHPNLLASTGYDIDPVTGQGKVVNPLGLHGYNCRHSHKPWDLRLRNPYGEEDMEDTKKSRDLYDNQQKQRAMERSIRATKRKLIEKEQQLNTIAETDVKGILQSDYDKLAYKMTQQNKTYNDFCKANDLQPQYDRIKVADFGSGQTKKANSGARRYISNRSNTVTKSSDSGIIKKRISNGEYSLSLSKQQYLKHVEGTKQYNDYRKTRLDKGKTPQGRILLSEDEAQKFVEKYSGTGIPKTDKKGFASNIEFVSADNIVGQYYKNGKWMNTKRVAIHHGKKASHIVPVEDKDND